MRWARRGWLDAKAVLSACLAALVLAAGVPQAQSAPAGAPRPPVIVLTDTTAPIEDDLAGLQWFDARGQSSLAEVLAGKGAFTPLRPGEVHQLGAKGALWVHLRLSRAAASRSEWLVEVPLPLIDAVTMHHQERDGAWRSESAGDTLAVDTWPEAGRYPVFRLELPRGVTRDVYLQIRHHATGNFPLRLMSEADHAQRMQFGYAGLGIVFGGLILLIVTCLAQSWVYRDLAYAWYAGYAALVTLAVASYTGVAAHLIWPQSGRLADVAQGCLGMLAGGGALLFVRDLSGISARHARLSTLVRVLGWSGSPLAIAYAMVDRPAGVAAVGIYLICASVLNVVIAWLSWRRADFVGLWVLAAFAPLTAAIMLVSARLFGLSTVSWGSQYSVVAALALQVPLLLVALNIRSRERHGAEIREQALSSQDALTGLLAPHLFHDRLRQVVARHKRDRENAAIVFIDLVNYSRIKDFHGSAVAEQSLLRCVIKLRRLLRDVDTVSRIGESRFGLILEGVTSRIAVTDRAARLIAAGLMPLKGLKPDVTLQFHIAAVLLEERALEPAELVESLDALLGSMSPRTRRPIRFLEPETTEPAALASDSSLLEQDSLPSSPGARLPPETAGAQSNR
jgi:diguanylate cyclase (GGDEF)-like protein